MALSRSASKQQESLAGLVDTPAFPAAQKAAALEIIKSCFGVKNRNGRIVSPLFEELPPKIDSPSNVNFYSKIPDPRSLRMVMDRLLANAYPSPRDLYIDLKAVFSQFSAIASKSSRDWADAVKMDQHTDEKWSTFATHRRLPTLDEMFPEDLPGATPPPSAPEAPVVGPTTLAFPTHTPAPTRPISAPATSPPQAFGTTVKRGRANSSSSTGSVLGAPSSASKKPRPAGAAPARPDEPRLPDVESGWMVLALGASALTVDAALTGIVATLRDQKDARGTRLITKLPSAAQLAAAGITGPETATLEKVEARLRDQTYSEAEDFDKDLARVFSSAREACQTPALAATCGANGDRLSKDERAAAVYTLQRLYQELTKKKKTASAQSKEAGESGSATGSGAATPAGGQSTVNKVLLSEAKFKGDVYKVGDFVHLMNTEDPAKPIIGQIFRLWRNSDTNERMVYVCWYYRPEQTVHQATRRFIENEVFRAYSFVDHPVEDILERCLVMFHTRYLRGRPRPPYWSPTMPTYICEHRYKDDIKTFKKIKNWTSCIPAEIRDLDEDEGFIFFPTPGTSAGLKRVPSPFAKAAGALDAGQDAKRTTADEQSSKEKKERDEKERKERESHGSRRDGPLVRLAKDGLSLAAMAAKQERFEQLPQSLKAKFRGRPIRAPAKAQHRLSVKIDEDRMDIDGNEDGNRPSTKPESATPPTDLLWFAAPPVAAGGTVPADKPHHSFEYLAWLAERTAAAEEPSGAERNGHPGASAPVLPGRLAGFGK